MKRVLLGLWAYLEFFGSVVLFLVPMSLATLLRRREPGRRTRGRWMRRLGRFASRLNPLWRFSVEGQAPRDVLRRGYVVIANHESTADPFLLSFLPWDMRWVAKEELFRLPLVGWSMRLGGDIPVRRGDGRSVRALMDECHRTLSDGVPVMIFPEGTRSGDGALLPFKDGAFELAIAAGVPILPVAVAGTRHCRPKGSLWFGEARAVAKVLEPLDTVDLGPGDVEALKEAARSRLEAALRELRPRCGPSAAPVVEEVPAGATQRLA